MKLTKTLTAKERARFDACKKQITEGLQSCFDTGLALAEVRDHKLYREDWDSFEQFCQETYKVSRAHAYRLIDAAGLKEERKSLSINKNLSPKGDISNEGQARALLKAPKEQREEILESVRGEGQITARAITAKAEAIAKPAEVLDETDTPIQDDELKALWERRGEVESKLRDIAALANFFKALQSSRDPLWIGVAPQAMMMELEHAHQTLGEARLFAICIVCQGRGRAKCAFCKGKGFISRFRWDQQATMEAKEMRRKANAKRRGA